MFKVRIVVGISHPHINFAKTTPKFPKVEIQPIHVLNTLVLTRMMIQFSNMWYILIEWINCKGFGPITFLFTEWLWSKFGRFCPKSVSASVQRPLEPRCSAIALLKLLSFSPNCCINRVNIWPYLLKLVSRYDDWCTEVKWECTVVQYPRRKYLLPSL